MLKLDATGIFFATALYIMMFGIACTIDVYEFKDRFKQPKALLVGFFCQYGILPLLGYSLAHIFSFDIGMSISLILCSTCPGGIISNYYCLLGGADVPLSIAMTTFSSLLSFLMIPINGLLYIQIGLNSENIQLDWIGMGFSIFVLISGVVSGLLSRHFIILKSKKYGPMIERVFVVIGCTFMALTFGVSWYLNFTSDYPIWEYSYSYWLAPMLLSMVSIVIATVLSKYIMNLTKQKSVTVAIETSMQNTSLVMAILVLSIDDQDEVNRIFGIPTIYAIFMYVSNGIALIIFYKLNWSKQMDPQQKNSDTKDIKYEKMTHELNDLSPLM